MNNLKLKFISQSHSTQIKEQEQSFLVFVLYFFNSFVGWNCCVIWQWYVIRKQFSHQQCMRVAAAPHDRAEIEPDSRTQIATSLVIISSQTLGNPEGKLLSWLCKRDCWEEKRGPELLHARTIPLTFIVCKEMLESLDTSFPHANTHIADPWLFLFSESQVQVTGHKERWGFRAGNVPALTVTLKVQIPLEVNI